MDTSFSRSPPRRALFLKVLHLNLDGWAVTGFSVQPLPVEPLHPACGGGLELLAGVPADDSSLNQFRLVQSDSALDQRVVVSRAYPAARSG